MTLAKEMHRQIDAFAKHVELLRPLLTAGQPMCVTPESADVPERLLWREMRESGFIDCASRSDHMGVPSAFANITITSRGRALIAEFDTPPAVEAEKKKEEHTLWRWWQLASTPERFGMLCFFASVFMFGFVAALVPAVRDFIQFLRQFIP